MHCGWCAVVDGLLLTFLLASCPAQAEPGEDLDSAPAEVVIAAFQRRAKAIAERAFWDSVQWRLAMGMQVRRARLKTKL